MSEVKKIATREAFGETLVELGKKHPELVVLDADLAAATKTAVFKKSFPDRHFDCGIAEANMMGVAAGLSLVGKIPVASSFAMFATGRAYEQIRNSIGYPHLNVKIGASHAGITVGEDGASHQCNEDIALMRSIPGMVVMNPSDAVEAAECVRAAIEYVGPVYMRFGRSAVPVINDRPGYHFEMGKGIVLREGTDVTIVATGILVSSALEAAKKLQRLTGGLVVLVHHSGKDASKGLRGHSSLYAAMDAVIEVGRNGDSRYWRLAKSKEGRDGIRRGFRLKSVGLGYDEDGEPITSCVVEEDNTPLQEEAKPLTPALRYALETLEAVLDRYKRYTVTLEQWREEFYARHTADNLNAKKVAFRRARMELQNIGKLSVINDEYGIIGRIQDDAVPVQAGTLPVQQQILYRTPDHAGIGTDGTHSFRSVPLVPSSEGPEYE